MFGLLFIAAGFAAYGAPTNQDAYYAYTNRVLVDVRALGDVLAEEDLKSHAEYPTDLILQRCVRKEDRKTLLPNGDIGFFSGYECIMEVWPAADPAFQTVGFFHHNGIEWIFYGQIQAARIPSPAQFDPKHGLGEQVTKPGAVGYEGNPRNPLNENYNPYQDHFDATDWGDNYINY